MKVYLDEGAKLPTRAYRSDAGLDLYCREDKIIKAGSCATFDTGVHIELPKNTFGKLESKSGLNVNHSIVACGGIIDEGYTGSIVVKLYNLGKEDYTFSKGDKICQLIISPYIYVDIIEDKINQNTERKNSGFGSSGR